MYNQQLISSARDHPDVVELNPKFQNGIPFSQMEFYLQVYLLFMYGISVADVL